MFSGGQQARKLKEEFRQHFRNISRIMDCVGCDKCKLWGKLQVSEYFFAQSLHFYSSGELCSASGTLSRLEASVTRLASVPVLPHPFPINKPVWIIYSFITICFETSSPLCRYFCLKAGKTWNKFECRCNVSKATAIHISTDPPGVVFVNS